MKLGFLRKTEAGWAVKDARLDSQELIPINPYEQDVMLDSDEGKAVNYKIETFWETGIEKPFDCAVIISREESGAWISIWHEWVMSETKHSAARFYEWLSENYEAPKKRRVDGKS